MVLGYSRRLSGEFTHNQRVSTLLACHQHAFEWLGGLTEAILDDNPNTVVLKREWDGRALAWHPQFWDFAPYDGFTPRRCRPSRAQTKSKVESGIKYVKRSFLPGRSFPGWEALNPTVQAWMVTGADQRIHGTTFGKPADAFSEEGLRSPLARPPYVVQSRVLRPVARDCLVTVETKRYCQVRNLCPSSRRYAGAGRR